MSLFFFNDTATTEIYTLSLHDALPISPGIEQTSRLLAPGRVHCLKQVLGLLSQNRPRSEEHTSELQSHLNLVCRLLLEKKKLESAHPLLDLINRDLFLPRSIPNPRVGI